MKEKGRLIVISGPSGAGKSTVVFNSIGYRKDCCFSTSVTTRKPRPGEENGREYFFITQDEFDEMVESGKLLEHARYVNNSYGTPKDYVMQKLEEGFNVILDIEVQGARQVRAMMPEAVMVFVAPPSLAELEHRLRNRGTETEETVKARLERARQEYREADFYNYIIINDEVERAANELSAIILAERCHFSNRAYILKEE